MRRGFAVGLACLALAAPGIARAQQAPEGPARCDAIDGGQPALAAVSADARLAFVRDVMRDQASRARTWRWAWAGIGLGLAAGQYALIPLYPASKTFEQAFEGTATLEIPLSMIIVPLHVGEYDEILERAAERATTPSGIMNPCRVLRRAEEMLVKSADEESQLTGVFMQVSSLLLAAAYTAVIEIAFRDLAGTILNGGGAFVLGEAQILTVPTGAVHALERYRRGDVGTQAAPAVAWSLAPLSVGGGAGLSIVARF